MKLVRVDHSKYINTDRIDAVVEYNPNETHVFTGDSYEPFVFNQPIKKVLDVISGSEEHSFIVYKKLKNKDLSQKAYVDVNNRQDKYSTKEV